MQSKIAWHFHLSPLAFNGFSFISPYVRLAHFLTAPDSGRPRKRTKRATAAIQFSVCCPVENDIVVPKDLQQIRVDNTEIQRRIDCFINRKRDEINSNNIQDFITGEADAVTGESTCARVHSTVYRIKDSKSHLKIHRVKNESGPQTGNYKDALDKLTESNRPTARVKADPDAPATGRAVPAGVQERLENVEQFLQLPAAERSNASVLQRLKQIEDKILFLETMSPEYMHFVVWTCIGIAVFGHVACKQMMATCLQPHINTDIFIKFTISERTIPVTASVGRCPQERAEEEVHRRRTGPTAAKILTIQLLPLIYVLYVKIFKFV